MSIHGLSVAPLRDPTPVLARVLARWGGSSDLWVFGYASLIWRPEFDFKEHRLATVYGYHRALKMWSRINRGSPECPGLVFALISGGSCRGMVFRIPHAKAADELHRLWQREMPTGVYDPKWLDCATPHGPVQALGFTLSRRSPHFTGALPEPELLRVLTQSCGRYGTTLDYLIRTDHGLRQHGIEDRAIRRLVQLARSHGLC